VAYEFSAGRPVRAEVSRLLIDELDGAIAQLRGQREAERVNAVHAARKHLKKARSVLRLVRGPLGEKVYARENGRLRDAGLRLSDVRDAQVAVATLDALSARFSGDLPAAAVDDVRGVLVSRRDAAGEQVHGGAELVGEVVAMLTKSRDRLERVRLDRGAWRALEGGLEVAYDRGSDAARRAEAKPTLDRLHEWRKRVKDSWYHLRLLTPAWPAVMEPLAEQAHRLSELLGDDHDLGVLRATLGEEAGPFDGAAELDTLMERVDGRRAELQREAFHLARRFYAESTKAHMGRLGAYWDAWRDQAPRERAEAPPQAGRRAKPTVLAEPQLPRPALGSVEVAPPGPRPAAIPEPQLAAPALGSVERAAFAPAPSTSPGAPVLPAPALGSHERPAAEPAPPPAAPPAAAAPSAAAPSSAAPSAGARSSGARSAGVRSAGARSSAGASGAGAGGNGAVEAVVGRPARAAAPVGSSSASSPPASRPAPRRAAASKASSPATEQVVATLTGRRYHRPRCPLAGAHPRALDRQEATAAGLVPCASCRP